MDNSGNLNKCLNCGGIFPLNSFVCEWCGYVETEKVKKVSETKIKKISFDESLSVIQDNLNTLQNINKPTVKDGILAILRIMFAIQTFGIVLIFWKKPKKQFNKKSYNNLKNIIQRNINLLKVSAQGSEDLLMRIEVIEKELHSTDIEIKKNLRTKQITVGLIIAGYSLFIILNASFNPIVHHKIYPLEKSVTGDLETVFEAVHKAQNLSYYAGENFSNFSLQLSLNTLETFTLNDSNELFATIILTDPDGMQSDLFLPAELSDENLKTLQRGLKRSPGAFISIYIDIQQKRTMSEIPGDLTNFKIHTEIKLK